MPVVEIDARRLARLVGRRRTKKAVVDALPYLGLDIESSEGDAIRVEYSPNRPDYATDYGIAEGLRGMLGVKTGIQNISIRRSRAYTMRIAPKSPRNRPTAVGIVARRLALDAHSLGQLIAMQEDLHAGIGRGRRVSSIGLHDLSAVKFPLEYATAPRSDMFVPLGSEQKMTLGGVLSETEIGRKYSTLLKGQTRVPVMLDASGDIISLPPVVNSAHTAVSDSTRGMFVEVTGTDSRAVADTLSITAATLAAAGADLYEVNIAGGSAPSLTPRKIQLRSSLVCETLGIQMRPGQIATCLRKSRLGAAIRGSRITCTIPRHRFDILGEMDLVEEAALGYGIGRIDPILPPQESAGRASPESVMLESVSTCMVGLGYTEAINSGLVSADMVKDLGRKDTSSMIAVMEPKSHVHTILRNSLVPGLLDVLARNIHETYPQRVYEIGTAFARAAPVEERSMLGAVTAHGSASYTEAKSAAAAVVRRCFGAVLQTEAASHSALEDGHAADILVGGIRVGVLGDVRTSALEQLRIRERVATFEIDLTALAKTAPARRPVKN